MNWLNRLKEATEITTPEFSDIIKKEPVSFRGAAEIVTPEGYRVWIATEPAAVKLIPPGAVFFQGDEVMQLQKASKETVRAALMLKQVFPGAGPFKIEAI